MKKALSVILALALIFSAVPLSGISEYLQGLDFGFLAVKSSAASESDLSFELNDDGESYYVSDCDESASGALEIPSTYNGKPVTKIGVYAFEFCSGLTSVEIPGSVTSIEAYAFIGCSSLTSVTIPDSVTSIGEHAFYGCSSLTLVTIGNSVTSIGDYAFSDCSGLTSVTIPDSVLIIGENAFFCCENIKTITIPYSVTSIGEEAFYGCSNLKSINVASDNEYYTATDGILFNKNKTELIRYPAKTVGSYTIPDGVTKISDHAFADCGECLESITISSTVLNIGDGAFSGCSSLTALLIPDSVTEIGRSAFCECSNLESVSLPKNIKIINDYLFGFCSKLSSITIPNAVTDIARNAFYGCTSLSELTIPTTVNNIYDEAFAYCSNLISIDIPCGVTSIGNRSFEGCGGLSSVTIGSNVESIGEYAFYKCSSLKSIEIPNNVVNIGFEAFADCDSEFVIYSRPHTAAEAYAEKFGVKWVNTCAHLNKDNHDAVAADSCTQIGYTAGVYCPDCDLWISGHEEVIIPHEDENRDYICDNCQGWLFDIIPDEVKTVNIEQEETVLLEFTPYVTETYAFTSDSYSDTYGYLYDADMNVLTSDDDSAGNGNFKIKYTLEAGKTYYFGARFYDGYNSGSLKISLAVYSPFKFTKNYSGDSYTVSGCDDSLIGAIVIPATNFKKPVTSIGNGAFYYCRNITSVIIPDSIESISYNAFYGCSSLKSIEIPDSVTSIGNYAFEYCTSLTSVTIPDSVTSIGYEAFYGCSSELTIYSKPNTAAEKYAHDNGINWVNSCNHANTENYEAVAVTSCAQPGYTAGVFCHDCEIWLSGHEEVTMPHNDSNCDYICDDCSNWMFDIIPNETKTIDIKSKNITLLEFTPYVTETYQFKAASEYGTHGFLYDSDMNLICSDERADLNDYWCKDFNVIWELEAGKTYYFGARFYNSGMSGSFDVSLCAYNPFTFTLNDDGISYSLSKCDSDYSGKAIIPAKYNNMPVTSIGSSAFFGCRGLTSVEIPDSVTSIGYGAFTFCESLLSVEIPGSVTSVSDSAFMNCRSLASIIIPKSVTDIGEHAFGFYSVDYDEWVSYRLVENATIYSYPNTAAEKYAKQNRIKWVNNCLHKNTEERAAVQAASCSQPGYTEGVVCLDCETWLSGHENVFIPHDDKDCNYICEVCGNWICDIIPDAAKEIIVEAGNTALLGFTPYLTDTYVFTVNSSSDIYGCLYDENMELLESGVCWYGWDEPLIKCILEAGKTYYLSVRFLESYQSGSFDILLSVFDPFTFTLSDDGNSYTFSKCDYSYCGDMVVPATYKGKSVTSIGDNAFEYCYNLTSVMIPDSVTSIGKGAFRYCSSLALINVVASNKNYSSKDGVLFNKDKTELICCPGGKMGVYTVPNSVMSIDDYAFCGCGSLTFITIPNSVTSIGEYAFYNCSSLTSITLGNSITSIGNNAFRYCSSLTSVIIPNSVTNIGSKAFLGCGNLSSITIPGSVVSIGDYAIGFSTNADDDMVRLSNDLSIYGFSGTYAETYAGENSITFKAVDILPKGFARVDYANKCIFSGKSIESLNDCLVCNTNIALECVKSSFGFIGTGTLVNIKSGDTVIDTYTMIINGDLDGDGVSDVLDAVLAERALHGRADLSAAQAYAANNSADTEIDAASYQNVVNRALGA